MYNLIVQGDIKKDDILVIDKIAGKSVHVRVLDASKPQVRMGPKFKDVKPPKKKGAN